MRKMPATPKSASINRIRIVDLPGIPLDDAVRGMQAYHLLSAPALIRYAQELGDRLKLPTHLHRGDPEDPEIRRDLPRYVDGCLANEDGTIREAARSIARRLGRNLGFVLLTLHRGDPANRDARADWTAHEWIQWQTIRRVWLGGGVVSGGLGEMLIQEAQALLDAHGYGAQLSVARTPRPHDMALLGAARYLPHPADDPPPQGQDTATYHALCLDLGQTSIKRAVATIDPGGALTHLHRLPPVAIPWRWRNSPNAADQIDGEAVLEIVSRAVAGGIELGKALYPAARFSLDIAMSIAAYIREGELLGNGIYARMSRLSRDAGVLIARHVAQETTDIRHPPRLHIVHDGTAAAALHAGEPYGAVIVVGTALGVGFPPADATGLRSLSHTV